MFLFRSQLRGGLPLTVFRFRPERTLLVFEASLPHLIKDGWRRIMNPPKAGRQFRDDAERLMTGL